MIGRIEEIIDNSVTIKLDININEQPNLVNLHVILKMVLEKKLLLK